MGFADLLSLVSTLAIVAAGVFAGMQVRQLNRQRARDSVLQLARSFQTPEFVNAVNIVFDIPENLSEIEIESRLGEKLTNVLMMFGTFESVGVLIYRREIDISLVEDYCGGVIVLAGRRFKRYLAETKNPVASNLLRVVSVVIRKIRGARICEVRFPRVRRASRMETLTKPNEIWPGL